MSDLDPMKKIELTTGEKNTLENLAEEHRRDVPVLAHVEQRPEEVLESLWAKGLTGRESSLGGPNKWVISSRGLAWLASHGYKPKETS